MGVDTEGDSFIEKVKEGDVEAVKQALEGGMDPNIADENGTTGLIEAAKSGHRELVGLLLDNGAEIEGRDEKFGGTALIWAVLRGRTETVELLLEKGADISAAEDKNGMPALILAAMQGQTDTIKFLLEKDADIDSRDKDGRSALMWAAHHGQVAAVEVLIDRNSGVTNDIEKVLGRRAKDFAEYARETAATGIWNPPK